MSVRINFRKIAYFCVLFVFCSPPILFSHPSLDNIDSVLDLFRAGFFLLIILTAFMSKYRNTHAMIFAIISIFWCSPIIMSLLNHSNLQNAIVSYTYMLSICLFSYLASKEHFDDYLKCLNSYFSFLVVVNFISLILFPKGIAFNRSMHNEVSFLWILGSENLMVAYLMPAMVFQSIRFVQTNNKVHILLLLISSLSIILSSSATALIGMALFLIFFVVMLWLYRMRIYKVLNINTFSVISVVVLVMFVIVGNFSVFEGIIVRLLGKDMTLTTRVFVWKKVMDAISQNPITGIGIPYISDFRNQFGVSHQHNYYLHIMHYGGLISLAGFLLFFNKCRKNLSMNMKDKTSLVLSLGIFSFMIMFVSEVYSGLLILPFYIIMTLSLTSTAKKGEN